MKDPAQIKSDLLASIEFFLKGDMTWAELAPYLSEAADANIEIPVHEGLSTTRCRLMINSYRFLKLRRPEALKRNPPPPLDTIGRLPNLYIRMDEQDKEKKFEEYIDQAIEGKLSCRKMKALISEGLGNNGSKVRPTGVQNDKGDVVIDKSSVDLAVDQAKALDYCLSLLEIAIENAVRTNGYDSLRKVYAEKCDRVASKLSCIADDEFRVMYEQRRGLSV